MKLLTIVIPSYNTEQFIDKNIKTYIDERLYNDVEILLINDGSQDKTREKIIKYENEYPGYIKAINKQNGGHGSVINTGIEIAKGKYFKVIDADDWVNTENLVKLVKGISKTDADIIINPYIKIDQRSNKTSLCGKAKIINQSENTIDFKEIIKIDYRLAMHATTIKTKILRDNKIKLTEKCFYEDFQYNIYPIPFLKTVSVFDFPVYYYLVGQKTQSVNASNGLKNISMYIKVLEESLSTIEAVKNKNEDMVNEYIENYVISYIRSLYNIYLRNAISRTTMNKMLESDRKVKELSSTLYDEVGKRNKYISIIRKGNFFCYSIVSILFKLYKAKDVS